MKDGIVFNRELFDFLEPDRPRNRWPELMTEGLGANRSCPLFRSQ